MPSSIMAWRTKAASAALFRLLASVLGLIASITGTPAGTCSRRPNVIRRGSTSRRLSDGSPATADAAPA